MPRIEWTTLDAVTMQFENQYGTVLREELDRRVVQQSRGWAVILFAYRQRKNGKQEFGEVRFAVEKWVKRKGKWRPHERLRFSFKNAIDFTELVADWTEEEEEDVEDAEEEEDDAAAA